MAAGTTISRLTGFVRAALLSYALGGSVHADIFNVANSLPNMLYILLAGGIFNAVLVPQLVRSLRNDPDRGDAYTSRVITVAGLFLVAVTVLLVVAAPLLVDLVAPTYEGAMRDSAIAFTRLCLPQVFFYGMYVLVGQILNARGSFGPMMWAPIANNVISVAVLLVYIVVLRPGRGRRGARSLLLRPGAAARPRLDARDRGPAADPGAVPAARRLLPTGPGSTCAAAASGTRCGWASGRCSS